MDIGPTPERESLRLVPKADWAHAFLPPPGRPIPAGTTAEIVFSTTPEVDAETVATWPATFIDETRVEFTVQAPQADLVPDCTFWRLYVHYPPIPPGTDTLDLCWFEGTVRR